MLDAYMHGSTTLWLIATALATGVVAAIALMRRKRSDDLGSVSAAWTTEHAAVRGFDGEDVLLAQSVNAVKRR
jgi:hypothetical protein